MKNKKVIAVIGAGFIGKHLINGLLDEGHAVRVIDRNVCPSEYLRRLSWIQADFLDIDVIDENLKNVDILYHLVSSTVPGDVNINIAKELNDNVIGTLGIVKSCVANNVQRLVFTSSASVYGDQERFPVNELAPTWPISAHGIHKLAIEKYLWLAKHEHELDIRIARLANPYGPGQSISGRQGFVAIAMGCLLRGEKLTLRDGGRMIRDFIYIEDAASALIKVGLYDDVPCVLNIGSGVGYSLLEVVELIEKKSKTTIEIVNAMPRRVDIPISVLDVTLAKKVLNFSPKISLSKGIELTLSYNARKIN